MFGYISRKFDSAENFSTLLNRKEREREKEQERVKNNTSATKSVAGRMKERAYISAGNDMPDKRWFHLYPRQSFTRVFFLLSATPGSSIYTVSYFCSELNEIFFSEFAKPIPKIT